MGKGNRNREQRRKQRITMERGEFKAYMFNVVEHCDDPSFERLCELFLMACGAIDAEGNLTEAYANSPYWTVEGGKLQPSANAKLLQQLSPEIRQMLEEMGNHEVRDKESIEEEVEAVPADDAEADLPR